MRTQGIRKGHGTRAAWDEGPGRARPKRTMVISSTGESRVRTLTFAHSPDPDDAFMFYGFASGDVTLPGHTIKHHMEDIESLNARALNGEFEITAVSAHAYAYVSKKYWVLSCGASVGR